MDGQSDNRTCPAMAFSAYDICIYQLCQVHKTENQNSKNYTSHHAALLTAFPIHVDFVKNIHSGVYTDLYKDYISSENRTMSGENPPWRCHIYILHFCQLSLDGVVHLCDITDAETGQALLACFSLYEDEQ